MAKNAGIWNVVAIRRQLKNAKCWIGMRDVVAFGDCVKMDRSTSGLRLHIASCGRTVRIVWELDKKTVDKLLGV